MNLLNPSDTNGIIVNGSDFYIPDPEIVQDKKPCHLKASLLGVYYGGQNVGSQWRFDISVNSSTWTSGRINLEIHNWYSKKVEIYDETIQGGCDRVHLITIFIRAREYDFYIFDDVGEILFCIPILCTPNGQTRRTRVLVPVKEYPYCRIFSRKPRRIAHMHFYFSIEAKCVMR